MKNLSKLYSFEKIYEEVVDENGKVYYPSHNSFLKSWRNNRSYQTKMNLEDLPEEYCSVQRYLSNYDVLSSAGIIDMHYSWVKENHFMKDSILRISYTGKLEKYYEKFNFNGKEITSKFSSYKNEDAMVFGYSIFKFLAYAHKYSNYPLDSIKSEFVKHCEWLNENEPEFAPNLDECNNYGEWFDNKIKKYFE